MTGVSASRGFGIFVAAAFLAACGARSYGPAGPVFTPVAIRDSNHGVQRYDCGMPLQKPDGKFVLMQSQGFTRKNKSGGQYDDAADGVWEYGRVTPLAEPPPSSEPKEPKPPQYVYVGTYALTNFKQHGCAYLVMSQSGKPIVDNSDATLDAAPWFGNTSVTMHASEGGKMHARAAFFQFGGSAKLELYDAHGSLIDTGSVNFTRRIVTNDLERRADALEASLHPDFTFSCNSVDYRYKTIQLASPGTVRRFGFDPKASGVTYVPHFGFCGVDNSVLTNSEVTNKQSYAFAHGAITYTLEATFSASVAWSGNPDVVVWEEAFNYDGTRFAAADIYLALARVR